jgi:hypothetical protein
MKQQLYLVALAAMKFDPESEGQVTRASDGSASIASKTEVDPHRGSIVNLQSEIRLLPYATFATSLEDARQIALERAREFFTEADGWVGHTANPMQVPPEMIAQAARAASEDDVEDSADEDADLPM